MTLENVIAKVKVPVGFKLDVVEGDSTKANIVVNGVVLVLHSEGYTDYATLSEAIEAISEDETLRLIADVSASDWLTINKNIKLDLNGKTLTLENGLSIDGNVEISGGTLVSNITVSENGKLLLGIVMQMLRTILI